MNLSAVCWPWAPLEAEVGVEAVVAARWHAALPVNSQCLCLRARLLSTMHQRDSVDMSQSSH